MQGWAAEARARCTRSRRSSEPALTSSASIGYATSWTTSSPALTAGRQPSPDRSHSAQGARGACPRRSESWARMAWEAVVPWQPGRGVVSTRRWVTLHRDMNGWVRALTRIPPHATSAPCAISAPPVRSIGATASRPRGIPTMQDRAGLRMLPPGAARGAGALPRGFAETFRVLRGCSLAGPAKPHWESRPIRLEPARHQELRSRASQTARALPGGLTAFSTVACRRTP